MKNPLTLPLSSLPRIGATLTKFLTKLVGKNRIFELLLHQPLRAEKITFQPNLFQIPNNSLIAITAKVESHLKPINSRHPYKIICHTKSGYLNLIFFKIFPSQLEKMAIGKEIAILGILQKTGDGNNITHPQEILPASAFDQMPQTNLIYPLGAAITQKFLTQKIREALAKIPQNNADWINLELLRKQSWPNFFEALKKIHNPQSDADFLPQNPARRRLAYDELLAWQIAINFVKINFQRKKISQKRDKSQIQNFLSSLPFQPTKPQLKAIEEICNEIGSDKKMLRLLQGDVGSGKTIVAIASCLQTIAQNQQACVLAPTTVLAKQHFNYFKNFLSQFEIKIALLTSATTKKQKSKICTDLISGENQILISTHAALEDDVRFCKLGLAIIDEQHRFGVIQRLKLIEKGDSVDTLLMSATPIPRSLMMALYGDMDISILNEKPKNRQKIETLIMSAKKTADIFAAIKRTIERDEKIYWVCPAIEKNAEPESSEVDLSAKNLANVTEKYEELVKNFGSEKVALLHGKMKEAQKDKIMQDFAQKNGDLKILVSTTVIEVGIDISEATVIIIENAENFGLSQLHQLRGRVGRSEKKSFCILLYGEKFGLKQRQRLNILRESNDGFLIAEEDLKMRGSGELVGTKQSGFPEFKIANLVFDSDLLKIANKQAQIELSKDPKLENQKNRELLELFEYDNCLKIVASG